MAVQGGDCPDEKLDNIFMNYKGRGVKRAGDLVWFEDGLAAKNPCKTKLSEIEFNVMQKHLSVL